MLAALAGCADLRASKTPLSPAPQGPAIFLLGEVHDNPDGHRQRAAQIAALLDAGWRPAIAMEQFDRERQGELDRAMATCADSACVVTAGSPPAAGAMARWNWPLYEPVIALALRYKLPLLAANLSRADAVKVMRGGFAAALDAATIARYGLGRAPPADLAAAQKQAINDGHCNKLPASMADGMVNAQIARDVWMARTVHDQSARGVILLAGNGHVRSDIAVPYWLRSAASAGAPAVRAVGYLEQGEVEKGKAQFDEIHMIAPHPRPDPCASL